MSKSPNEIFAGRYGPWALVAGASKGLGAEFAAQLAQRGLNLVLVARSATALEALAEQLTREYKIQVRLLEIDLAGEESAERISDETSDLEIGLLVVNAAFSAIGPFFDLPLADHLREIETNVRTPLSLTYLLGSRMLPRKRGGIILMSSLSSLQGSAMISNYAASKAYNRILAEGLWEELRTEGIDVLSCWAGAVNTPNYQASLESRGKREISAAMPPGDVARETLTALGKRSGVIPGITNRLAGFMMQRLLPRGAAIRLMGGVLRKMYS